MLWVFTCILQQFCSGRKKESEIIVQHDEYSNSFFSPRVVIPFLCLPANSKGIFSIMDWTGLLWEPGIMREIPKLEMIHFEFYENVKIKYWCTNSHFLSHLFSSICIYLSLSTYYPIICKDIFCQQKISLSWRKIKHSGVIITLYFI